MGESPLTTLVTVLASAFLLDYILGDPVYRLHPVRCIGALICHVERTLRRAGCTNILGGVLLSVSVIAVAVTACVLIYMCLAAISRCYSLVFATFVIYSCLALRDMTKHAAPITEAIDNCDIQKARVLVQRIVGRDASQLDLEMIARATVESIAESFVDGFLSPVFWCLAAGVAGSLIGDPLLYGVIGIVAYRATNTLDSMVGYHNEKYEKFGKFSARLDDVLNFIPARLSLVLFVPAAFLSGLDASEGWRIAMRDRLKHASPNSAHTEGFIAGAVGLRLGGPTVYVHGNVDKPWIGDGTKQVRALHIEQASRLVTIAGALLIAVALAVGYAL